MPQPALQVSAPTHGIDDPSGLGGVFDTVRVGPLHVVRPLSVNLNVAHACSLHEVDTRLDHQLTELGFQRATIDLIRLGRQEPPCAVFGPRCKIARALKEVAQPELLEMRLFQIVVQLKGMVVIKRADFDGGLTDLEAGMRQWSRDRIENQDGERVATQAQLPGESQAGQATTTDDEIEFTRQCGRDHTESSGKR